MFLIGELASYGLIHGDFNEFNLLLTREPGSQKPHPIIIDFPQMVSIDHSEGKFYFERDVECIRVFFNRRFGFVNEDAELEPVWEVAKARRDDRRRLDVELRASGYTKPKRVGRRQAARKTGADGVNAIDESESESDESDAAEESDEEESGSDCDDENSCDSDASE